MKTIYNLQKGDSYWRPSPVIDLDKMSGKFEPQKIEIINAIDLLKYETDLTHGKVSLTKKECQRSIDYDVALAKINKRASELGEVLNKDGERYTIDNWISVDTLPYLARGTTKLEFSSEEVADIIVEELPEECKTVLGVE